MAIKLLATIGLFFLLVAAQGPAANRINGTERNDVVAGTDGDDEIRGLDGDDEIRGGAGDDTLIGGSGFDTLFGGPGADNFVIEFLSNLPDEFMDFRPEEGDTLSLRLPAAERQKIAAGGIQIDRKGVLTLQLLGGERVQAVKMNRRDLSLRVDGARKDIRLVFSVMF